MIRTQPIEQFLENLSAATPTPGGGAASCVAGATACAQTAMVAAVTMQGPRKEALLGELTEVVDRLDSIREDLLNAADADGEAYHAVTEAQGLPKGTSEEAQERTKRLQAALKGATEPPMRVLQAAEDVTPMLERLAVQCSKPLLSDVAVSAALLGAAVRGAMATIEANVRYLRDPETQEDIRGEVSKRTEPVLRHLSHLHSQAMEDLAS